MLYQIYKILPIKIRWTISYFYADKFLIGVLAFVRKDNQLLFLKLRYQYHWGLPGGFLKKGENIHTAIQREIREETGLEVKINKIIDVRNGAKRPILDIVIECEVVGGEIIITDKEVERAEFFDLDKIPDDILKVQEQLVEDYKNNYYSYIRNDSYFVEK
jgi:ADP-ribose pyrophosphatase YjhB (NUDIX family)